MKIFRNYFFIISFSFVLGCTSGSSGGGGLITSTSNIPTIGNVELERETVSGVTTVTLMFSFSDLDGDVTTGKVLKINNNEEVTIDLSAYTGQKSGTISFSIVIDTSLIKSWGLEIWIVDVKGNKSTSRTQAFEV